MKKACRGHGTQQPLGLVLLQLLLGLLGLLTTGAAAVAVREPHRTVRGPMAAGVTANASARAVPVRLLHLTDLHGWVAGHAHLAALDADYGDFVSMVEHAKAQAAAAGVDLLVFDTGDLIEGTGYSDAVPGGYHGEYILPIVAQAGFDGLTAGNHDLGHDQVIAAIRSELVPSFGGRYLTSNTNQTATQVALGSMYNVLTTTSGKRVLVLGFIYNFLQAAGAVTVVDVQKALQEGFFGQATATEAIDFVVVLNHIAPQVTPGTPDLLRTISRAVRAQLPTTPIVLLSGHSHVEDFVWYDANSFTIESGKYFEEIGQVDFTLDPATGALSNDSFAYKWVPTSRENLYDLAGVRPPAFETAAGTAIKQQLVKLDRELGLSEVQGCSPTTFDTDAPMASPNSTYRLLVEEIAPKILFSYDLPNIQFFISSTGFLRYNLYEGKVTTNDVWTVCGFNDSYAYYPAVPGALLQQIISTLESLPPALLARAGRPGCRGPTAAGPVAAAAAAADRRKPGAVAADDTVGEERLPFYVYSYSKISPSGVYDLICNSYDAGTIDIVLEHIFAGGLQQGATPPVRQWYPNTISDTYMIRDYVRKYMPCQAPSDERIMLRGTAGR
jgi:2',3'-cyclic-nucleotide 2'-phosphodiesterase (5'-nucleotidase family)